MKNKSTSIIIVCSFWFLALTSCGKKEHETIILLPADTITNTIVITDINRDTVFTDLQSDVFIDQNKEEIKDILINLDENTQNGTEVLTFTNTEFNYNIISGNGFSILDNKLQVIDNTYLDYESNTGIILTIEVNTENLNKQFDVLVLLNDVVDIPELKAHFTFDNQDLVNEVDGESMSNIGSISYVLNNSGAGNYYIDFSGNENNKILEWDETIINLNQDFSICFFGLLKQAVSESKETIIVGYNDSEEEVITVFIENGIMKIGLNGIISDLSYSVFNSSSNNIIKTALIKSNNTFSLRVNNNGVSEMIYNENLDEVTHWSFGAEKSPSSNISNSYDERLDNLRFYQKAITLEEYISIISVDY